MAVDEYGRAHPSGTADEAGTLVEFLDYQRATLAWKCSGVPAEGLRATTAASSMTLGGLLKHMAWVEDYWFGQVVGGAPASAPWDAIDWEAEHDWEWRSAAEDAPAALRDLWATSCARSRDLVAAAVAGGGLDRLVLEREPEGGINLRWVLVHMIEEYARHNGHADLLREAWDGETGE